MACRILLVGDIHIGRWPGGLPEDLLEFGIKVARLTPASAWHAAVDWALKEGVHAVVLAGDVVESTEDRFEAFGHIEREVRRLVQANIPILGVSGNHDAIALTRLADRIGDFRLLGRGGTWESAELSGDGVPVRICGWSFPGKSHTDNPLDQFHFDHDPAIASIGVLHCDLDGGRSNFAPVPMRDLVERTSMDGWFLGHEHKPSYAGLAGERPIGYLGSLSGLDAGETGAHGPWLVEVDGPGLLRANQIRLAPIRYERELISIEQIQGSNMEELRDSLGGRIQDALTRTHKRIQEEELLPQVVACRLRLEGRSKDHRAIRRILEETIEWSPLHQTPHCFVEKIEDGGEPAVDLNRIAGGGGVASMLASKIIALGEGGEEAQALIREAAAHLGSVLMKTRWDDVTAILDSEEKVRQLLLHAATGALEELLAQKVNDAAGVTS